jgi:hypothetical protein
MKKIIEKKKRNAGSDVIVTSYEPDENLEFDKSEYEEDNFYSFSNEDQTNLGEIIKSWEFLRYSL